MNNRALFRSLLLTASFLPLPCFALEAGKPIFASSVVSAKTPGQSVDIKVELNGATKLYLVVTDGGDGFMADWAEWIDPRITGDFGEKKLTDLKWKNADTGWGKASLNTNSDGKPMMVAGQPVANGIAAHAPSMIEFDLPAGAKLFAAKGAIDDGGTKQGGGSTVTFEVYTTQPNVAAASAAKQKSAGGQEPADALAALDVAESLTASTFAAEPDLLSPSSIDIDAQGRVWVAEIVNYRAHNGKRPDGDRILILEDTNGDGKADKQKVFYQGRDIDSPHGICVLGNKVIVSAKGTVYCLTDTDGDDKADKTDIWFTGIDGAQHDHSIHAFMFGPDGRLYFNMGNEGHQLKDKDGKIIMDLAGNPVTRDRKPYQEGMIFRCEQDGTKVETLAWNFRNNWEMVVDSFGGMWQSDNDDDGNKGVRINYILEYGNYGYKDEMTGANWSAKRTNWEEEIPLRHWHQNDPGSVPNLINTGAGSPTGILVNEGSALPAAFQNQIIHCDAGPNIVRAYPVTKSGAGYKAEIKNILESTKDKWFRPADVSMAPDGTLFVADWYDPGVGGHGMGDLARGRVYRLASAEASKSYTTPALDVKTAEGAVAALKSPNNSTRYEGWTALNAMGEKAEPALKTLWADANPRFRARALWLLARLPKGAEYVKSASTDKDEDIRVTSIRAARQLNLGLIPHLQALAGDSSPQVRREVAVALHGQKDPAVPALWAKLASQHDGKDRWYLEALGIGADGQWDACLDAYLAQAGEAWTTEPGRDIIWRSRAAKTPGLLVKVVKVAPEKEQPRYIRAMDFQKDGPDKQKALDDILLQ